jgi:hypothetical protein
VSVIRGALRRSLAEIGEEEGEPRAKALPRRGSYSLHDLLRELVAEEAAAVERLPDRSPHRCDLVGAECGVHYTCRIGPGGKSLAGRAEHRASRRVPERQLVRRVDVKRAADRPGLDQLTPLPQRCTDVGLRDAVDPGSQLELGRRLDLRVHATHGADDFHEPLAAGGLTQERTRQTARAYLIPSDVHVG